MKAKEFNKLRPSEKWSLWKKQTGIWKCGFWKINQFLKELE